MGGCEGWIREFKAYLEIVDLLEAAHVVNFGVCCVGGLLYVMWLVAFVTIYGLVDRGNRSLGMRKPSFLIWLWGVPYLLLSPTIH